MFDGGRIRELEREIERVKYESAEKVRCLTEMLKGRDRKLQEASDLLKAIVIGECGMVRVDGRAVVLARNRSWTTFYDPETMEIIVCVDQEDKRA